jgi:hypothetical protein
MTFTIACRPALLVLCVLITSAAVGAQQDDPRLVAIGGLAGSHIYTTYGYIGTVADLFAYEKYDTKRVQDLMKEVVSMADVGVKQLHKVRETNIGESDKKVLDDMVVIYGLLQQEANALSDYSVSKSKEHLDAFTKSRTEAWPKIKAVLGIKD